MAKGKMVRQELTVVKRGTGEKYPVQAEQHPRASDAGIFLYLKLNQIGIKHIQENAGVDNFVTTPTFCKWFSEKTGCPAEGIGNLGLEYECFNAQGVKIFPTPTMEAQPANAAPQVTPAIADTTQVAPLLVTPEIAVPQIPVAKADTTEVKKDFYGTLKSILVSAKVDDNTVYQQLVGKLGESEAKTMWIKAKTELATPAPVAQAVAPVVAQPTETNIFGL